MRALRNHPAVRLYDTATAIERVLDPSVYGAGAMYSPGWRLEAGFYYPGIHYISPSNPYGPKLFVAWQKWANGPIAGQAIGDTGIRPGDPVPGSWYQMGMWWERPSDLKAASHAAWGRPKGTYPDPSPSPRWASTLSQPAVRPGINPAIDPFALPINQPVPDRKALPWRLTPYLQPNPWRSPHEQTQRGPQPAANAAPKVHPRIDIDISGRVRVDPTPRPHQRRKPPPNVRERKVDMRVGGVAAAVIGFTTEGLDFINAVYKALPDQYKPGYYFVRGKWVKRWNASQWQRMNALWRHWDKVDIGQAINEVAKNQIEDKIFGGIGAAVGKATFRAGFHRGIQVGPWDSGPIMP